MASEQLFTPISIGQTHLRNRVVMAPLTRFRAHADHVQSSERFQTFFGVRIIADPHFQIFPELAVDYYSQRATSAGLIITEGTFISPEAGGFRNIPGIWNAEQVQAWKEVIDGGELIDLLQLRAPDFRPLPQCMRRTHRSFCSCGLSDVEHKPSR